MSLIPAIIASGSFQYPAPPWVDLSGNSNVNVGCVRRDYNMGYFGDDPNWFNLQTPSSTTYPTTIDIGDELNSPIDVDNYSIQWTGYWIPIGGSQPNNYIFRTWSDDGSYFWIGPDALNPTTSNALVSNGGPHGSQYVVSSPITLTGGGFNRCYPFRAQYGEISGGAQMRVEVSADNGNTWYNMGNNAFYDVTTPDGYAA